MVSFNCVNGKIPIFPSNTTSPLSANIGPVTTHINMIFLMNFCFDMSYVVQPLPVPSKTFLASLWTVFWMFLKTILFRILSSSMASSVNVNGSSLFGVVKSDRTAELCGLINLVCNHLQTEFLLYFNTITKLIIVHLFRNM